MKDFSGKSIPSWFVYRNPDMVIMAQRAGAKESIVVKSVSQMVTLSYPSVVAKLIEKAAAATVK